MSQKYTIAAPVWKQSVKPVVDYILMPGGWVNYRRRDSDKGYSYTVRVYRAMDDMMGTKEVAEFTGVGAEENAREECIHIYYKEVEKWLEVAT